MEELLSIGGQIAASDFRRSSTNCCGRVILMNNSPGGVGRRSPPPRAPNYTPNCSFINSNLYPAGLLRSGFVFAPD